MRWKREHCAKIAEYFVYDRAGSFERVRNGIAVAIRKGVSE
jgi:hypothetical protein